MPTHLLLEGADIESVLAELRDSHGPDAKIVQAELVRSGGIAGFFAKRRYEVTVEVDDAQPVIDPAAERAAAAMAAMPMAAEPMAPMVPMVPMVPAPLVPMAPAGSVDFGIDALLSAAESGDQAMIGQAVLSAPAAGTAAVAEEPTAPGWHRPVSTEGNAFSDVLDSLTQSLAEQQRDPEPAFEPFAAYPLPRPRIAEDTQPAETVTEVTEVTDIAEFADEDVAEVGAEVVEEVDPVDLTDPFGVLDSGSTIRPFAPPIPAPLVRVAPDFGPVREQLADLGLSPRLLEQVASAEPLLALWDVVGTLPAPRAPQLRPSATRGGALVVVVGAWTVARSAVEVLMADLGIGADAMFTVGASGADLPATRTVRSHAAAIDLVRSSRQEHDASLLLVDPGAGMHSAARVAELVATLEAQYVVVAGDAGADLGVCLTALDALDGAGVAVDAIALDGVTRADQPAAILEVPIAVGWVDGRPATPGSWIGLLMDTLTARGAVRSARSGRSHRC